MNELIVEKLRAVLDQRVRRGRAKECWLWTGAVSRNGYGAITVRCAGEVLNTAPHRAAYIVYIGDIPPNTCVCHACDTPLCANPAHLFLGSKQQNMRDCAQKKRVRGQKLSPADAAAIFQSSATRRSLARRYGVGVDLIRDIKRRKIHVTATAGLVRGVWRAP